MAENVAPKSNGGSGLDPKVAGLLAWIFAPVSSIIFIAIEKEDKFVKFHAWESLFASLAGWVVYFILTAVTLGFGSLCAWIIPLAIQVYGAIKAYQGEMYKFPMVGDWAEKQAGK